MIPESLGRGVGGPKVSASRGMSSGWIRQAGPARHLGTLGRHTLGAVVTKAAPLVESLP